MNPYGRPRVASRISGDPLLAAVSGALTPIALTVWVVRRGRIHARAAGAFAIGALVVARAVARALGSELGVDLGLGRKTIESALSRLFIRFDVTARTELAIRAERDQLLGLPVGRRDAR